MKKYFLLFLLPLFFFFSCDDDDGYSLGKYWVSIATVENPDDTPYFYLRLDNEELLWTAATNLYNYRPKTGQRVCAVYTILNDKPEGSAYQHDVKLNDAYNILTKNVFYITPEQQDSIGNDPIGVDDMWIGSNYLNIEFYYGGYYKTHFINLVKDDSKEYDDNKLHLEFRHNGNEDERKYKMRGIVSFDLLSLFISPLDESSQEKTDLVIHVKNIDGEEITYDFQYDPKKENKNSRELTQEKFYEVKSSKVE